MQFKILKQGVKPEEDSAATEPLQIFSLLLHEINERVTFGG